MDENQYNINCRKDTEMVIVAITSIGSWQMIKWEFKEHLFHQVIQIISLGQKPFNRHLQYGHFLHVLWQVVWILIALEWSLWNVVHSIINHYAINLSPFGLHICSNTNWAPKVDSETNTTYGYFGRYRPRYSMFVMQATSCLLRENLHV